MNIHFWRILILVSLLPLRTHCVCFFLTFVSSLVLEDVVFVIQSFNWPAEWDYVVCMIALCVCWISPRQARNARQDQSIQCNIFCLFWKAAEVHLFVNVSAIIVQTICRTKKHQHANNLWSTARLSACVRLPHAQATQPCTSWVVVRHDSMCVLVACKPDKRTL